MLRYGGPAWDDVHILSDQIFCRNLLIQVQQIGEAIEMVKILEESKVQCLPGIGMLFVHGEPGCEIGRQMLVANRGLDHLFINGFEPVDALLLLLFNPAS